MKYLNRINPLLLWVIIWIIMSFIYSQSNLSDLFKLESLLASVVISILSLPFAFIVYFFWKNILTKIIWYGASTYKDSTSKKDMQRSAEYYRSDEGMRKYSIVAFILAMVVKLIF